MQNDQDAEVYAKLEEVFQVVFDDHSIVLSSGTTSDDIPGWDSLTYINLITSIEQRFDVQFSTSEIGRLRNVGALVDCLRAKGI